MIYYTHRIFKENAQSIGEDLNDKIMYIKDTNDINENELIFIIGMHVLPHKLWLFQQEKKVKYYIIQTENWNSRVLQDKYMKLLLNDKQNIIYDYSFLNRDKIQCQNEIYFFKYETSPKYYNTKREFDLCFIGARTNRRLQILRDIKRNFPALKCYFSLGFNVPDVTNIYENSKYVLNISCYNEALETHRINKALFCGCQVISEYSKDTKMNEIYNDYVHFGDIIKTIFKLNQLEKKKPIKELCTDEFLDLRKCVKDTYHE